MIAKLAAMLVVMGAAMMTFAAAEPETTLWYGKPASKWEEALPVGNGRLGAMVFGGVAQERIQLNEDSVWSGGPQDADNPAALVALPKIRALLFAGKYAEAQALTDQTQICEPSTRGSFGAYQMLGDLHLAFAETAPAGDYRRELNLDDAVVRVSYRIGDVKFVRETFSSARDQVIVTRITADKPGKVSFTAKLSRPECAVVKRAGDSALELSGQLFERDQQPGMKFAAQLRAIATGGRIKVDEDSLHVEGADSVILLLAAGTDYRGKPYEKMIADQLAAASALPYEQLLSRHLADHRALFRRCMLDLGRTEASKLPTDQRLVAFANGGDDPALIALYFHLGRYLLISSSRPGGLPANLQGLWADGVHTPWNCDYHTNINVQMNYWLAETTNLPQCVEPLVELIDAMRESGARTAKIHYNAGGWTVHTIHNVWGFTSPGENPSWGMFPMAGPWLCQHLWEHYTFSGDKEFLRRVWPIMRESAQFCLDWLVIDPRTGTLVSGPVNSPENSFIAPDGSRCSISMGPSMDQEIAWDLFTNVLDAAAALGVDDEFVKRVAEAREKLATPKIGADGRLMEWAEEFSETEPHHRHVSHLFALHPGRQISLRMTPELAEAARKSLLARGDGGTGWSMAWKICFWARLGDGDHALTLLRNLLHPTGVMGTKYDGGGAGVYPNLFCAHPPFQIDGNLGGAAGIAEMLLQSQDGEITLLPALPHAWANGSATGLRARGGFTIDLAWHDGRLTRATVHASLASACRIRSGDAVIELKAEAGKTYSVEGLFR